MLNNIFVIITNLGLQSKIETEHKFSVIRGGDAQDVVVSDLVVGDIARLKYGDTILFTGIIYSFEFIYLFIYLFFFC